MMRENGCKTGIITSEDTALVDRRAKKIKCDFLIQGKKCGGKLEVLKGKCDEFGISLSEVAYIGDDINCIEILRAVGFPACPADACDKVKAIPGITVLQRKGGEGCVREFAEKILGDF